MNIFQHILHCLNIPYTTAYSSRVYEEHPYRDSLYGLFRLLALYGVQSQGVRVTDKESLASMPVPFVAQVSGEFVLVSHVSPSDVGYEWKDTHLTVTHEDFKRYWSGVALVLSRTETSCEPDYREHRRKERAEQSRIFLLSAAIAVLLSCCIHSQWQRLCWEYAVPIVPYAAGSCVCCLLLTRQLQTENRLADKICTLLKQGTCTDVLDSPASRFMLNLSWSEIGFGYFLGGMLALLACPDSRTVLAVFSVCALPYTLWSVWYQWRRARHWCVLCLLVQGLLWLLAAGLIWLDFRRGHVVSIPSGMVACSILVILVFSTHFVVRAAAENRENRKWKHACRRIKANARIFSVLQKEQTFHPCDAESTTLSFGRQTSPHCVSIFSNPYCNPCSLLHPKVHALLDAGIRVQYILSAFNDELLETNRYLTAAYQQLGEERGLAVIDAWYSGGKTLGNGFFLPYHLDINTPEVQEEIDRHLKWRERENLHATPLILVDGYELHDTYDMEDLVNIL